jgi:hypothetical protein
MMSFCCPFSAAPSNVQALERGEIGVVAVAGRGSEQKRFGGVDVTVNQRRTRRSYGEK